MRITVTDTNVFIDLIHLQWLGYLTVLQLDIYTTEYVLLELHEYQRKELEAMATAGHLKIQKLVEKDLEEIAKLNVPRGFSPTDNSVVWLALKHQAMVLTGDAPVRKYCEKGGLEVHGIIWVLDQLTEQAVISLEIAVQCLEKLMKINKRLPFEECEKRLKAWQK